MVLGSSPVGQWLVSPIKQFENCSLLRLTPEFPGRRFRDGAQRSACLTSCPVLLTRLLWGPHFENRWSF